MPPEQRLEGNRRIGRGRVNCALIDDERQGVIGDVAIVDEEDQLALQSHASRDILPSAAIKFDSPARNRQKGTFPGADRPRTIRVTWTGSRMAFGGLHETMSPSSRRVGAIAP